MATQSDGTRPNPLRMSHEAFMRLQARLMAPGSEFEWILQNAAGFRDWVESFAPVVQSPDPELEAIELLVLVPRRFRSVRQDRSEQASIDSRK